MSSPSAVKSRVGDRLGPYGSFDEELISDLYSLIRDRFGFTDLSIGIGGVLHQLVMTFQQERDAERVDGRESQAKPLERAKSSFETALEWIDFDLDAGSIGAKLSDEECEIALRVLKAYIDHIEEQQADLAALPKGGRKSRPCERKLVRKLALLFAIATDQEFDQIKLSASANDVSLFIQDVFRTISTVHYSPDPVSIANFFNRPHRPVEADLMDDSMRFLKEINLPKNRIPINTE